MLGVKRSTNEPKSLKLRANRSDFRVKRFKLRVKRSGNEPKRLKCREKRFNVRAKRLKLRVKRSDVGEKRSFDGEMKWRGVLRKYPLPLGKYPFGEKVRPRWGRENHWRWFVTSTGWGSQAHPTTRGYSKV